MNGRWCMGRSFLDWGWASISASVSNRTHMETLVGGGIGERVGGWPNAAQGMLSEPGEGDPCLEEGAGAFWGRRGCVRGAVTHGEYVVVAGDVGAARDVVGTLGEARGHSIGSLQDAHSRLCGHLRKKEGNSGTEMVRNSGGGGKHTHTCTCTYAQTEERSASYLNAHRTNKTSNLSNYLFNIVIWI